MSNVRFSIRFRVSYAFLVIPDFDVCSCDAKLTLSHVPIRIGRGQTAFVMRQRFRIFSAEKGDRNACEKSVERDTVARRLREFQLLRIFTGNQWYLIRRQRFGQRQCLLPLQQVAAQVQRFQRI